MRQRGVALITVLLMVAMATTVAAFMAQQQAFWQRGVASGRDRAQAAALGQAGVDWARAVLADDKVNNAYDHARELWAVQLPAIPVEGGEVAGHILERQGLFNLNNLVRDGKVSAADVARLQRLLALLGLPQDLAWALADWMDADDVPAAGGAEDRYYLALPQPYRAANAPLEDLSELLWVRGFDRPTLARLQPYVTVLPGATPLNVNFAPAEVLAAVVDGLSLGQARQLVEKRKRVPWQKREDFMAELPRGVGESSRRELDVASEFFLVRGQVRLQQGEYAAEALLQRRGVWANVIWQHIE
ncbi:MAG: type II secretion system minor pseudopilin GspK [Sideroxydans sp.]